MAGPDLSLITAAIDFGFVVSAVVGVFAAAVVMYISVIGAKLVLRAVRDGGVPAAGVREYSDWDNVFGGRRVSRGVFESVAAKARASGIDEHQIRSIAKVHTKNGWW